MILYFSQNKDFAIFARKHIKKREYGTAIKPLKIGVLKKGITNRLNSTIDHSVIYRV